jgi:hypothetical protein
MWLGYKRQGIYSYRILVWKPLGKCPHGRPKEMGGENEDRS